MLSILKTEQTEKLYRLKTNLKQNSEFAFKQLNLWIKDNNNTSDYNTQQSVSDDTNQGKNI